MLRQITSRQFSEWEAYDRLDPIGEWRTDLNFATLEALIINIANAAFSDPKKTKPKETSPLELMPDWAGDREKPKGQSVEMMKQILLGIAKEQNKRVARDKALKNTPPVKKADRK